MPINVLIPRLGGPMGRCARPIGLWFDPAPWAFAVASVTLIVAIGRNLAVHREAWGDNQLALAAAWCLCFVVLVGCQLWLGRDSQAATRTSWDGVLVAVAPPVALAEFVGWHVAGAALVAAALVAWTRRRVGIAGVLLGAGGALAGYPLLVLAGLGLLCVRDRRPADAGWMVASAAAGCAAVTGAWFVLDSSGWRDNWLTMAVLAPEPGSLSYVMQLAGLAPQNVGIAAVVLGAAGCGLIVAWILRSVVRPRVGQVVFLLVASVVLVAPGYPVGHAIWLWPLLVLARPRRADLVLFAVAEVAFAVARWAYEAGYLTIEHYGPERVYWAVTLLRLGLLVAICVRIVLDVWQPWRDSLRLPLLGDPIGGPLGGAQAATGSA